MLVVKRFSQIEDWDEEQRDFSNKDLKKFNENYEKASKHITDSVVSGTVGIGAGVGALKLAKSNSKIGKAGAVGLGALSTASSIRAGRQFEKNQQIARDKKYQKDFEKESKLSDKIEDEAVELMNATKGDYDSCLEIVKKKYKHVPVWLESKKKKIKQNIPHCL